MRCSFESLCLYLHNSLTEERKLAVTDHLHQCEICREAVLTMLQDGDGDKEQTLSILADLGDGWQSGTDTVRTAGVHN